MTGDAQIRSAIPADASSLAALSIEVWLNTYAVDGILPAYAEHVMATFTKTAFAIQIEDPDIRILVCHRAGALLGYVKLCLAAQPPNLQCGPFELATLYVRSPHRKLGIGTGLFDRAATVARQSGAAAMFLTVLHSNAAAIDFYRSRGMRYQSDWIYEFQGISAVNSIYGMALT